MARGGGSKRGGPARPVRRTPAGARPPQPAKPKKRPSAPPAPAPEEPRTFHLGAVPGATPGKWISTWRERLPHVELVLHVIPAADQLAALVDGDVDAALVRLPVDDDRLHAITLYDEITVAVVAADSHLTAADELDLADLTGEVLIVPADDVLGLNDPGAVPGAVTPSFAPPADTAEAIATAAAGVGVVVVPMSLARANQRKDVEHRPVRDAPGSRVGVAWLREAENPDIDAFVGIVRGRTANSSR